MQQHTGRQNPAPGRLHMSDVYCDCNLHPEHPTTVGGRHSKIQPAFKNLPGGFLIH